MGKWRHPKPGELDTDDDAIGVSTGDRDENIRARTDELGRRIAEQGRRYEDVILKKFFLPIGGAAVVILVGLIVTGHFPEHILSERSLR